MPTSIGTPAYFAPVRVVAATKILANQGPFGSTTDSGLPKGLLRK